MFVEVVALTLLALLRGVDVDNEVAQLSQTCQSPLTRLLHL